MGVTVDFDALEKALSVVVANAQSLAEIEAWIKSQPGVRSVKLANYLLKSNPPQRDFIVQFARDDDSTVQKIVNIFDLGNHQFKFNKLRDR